MSNPRLSALIIAKTIAERFSDAEDMGGAVADIVTGAHVIAAFLEGKDVSFEPIEDDEEYEDDGEAVH